MISEILMQHCRICHAIAWTICDGCGIYLCRMHTRISKSMHDGGVDHEYCPHCIIIHGEGITLEDLK